MKKENIKSALFGFIGAATFWVIANGGSAMAQSVKQFIVRLQDSTPGVQQTGNSNISGTAIAGTFIGSGSGLTNVDAFSIGGQKVATTAPNVKDVLTWDGALWSPVPPPTFKLPYRGYANTGNSGDPAFAITNDGYAAIWAENIHGGTGLVAFADGQLSSAIYAQTEFANSTGVSISATGLGAGIYSSQGWGIYSVAGGSQSSGAVYALYGLCESNPVADAVVGEVLKGNLNAGVYGLSSGTNGNGVIGESNTGSDPFGVWGKTTNAGGYGLYSTGRTGATGTKSFRIDHPLDPYNKYLLHYSHEGPEAQNVYNGNITTDSRGYATVQLPDYFESINKDPRFQLTVVDKANRADFVLAKVISGIENNRFKIRTSAPNTLVSWRVDAVRNDRFVQAYGAPIEQEKTESEQGTLQHPELYGQGPERGMKYNPYPIESAKRPAPPKRLKPRAAR